MGRRASAIFSGAGWELCVERVFWIFSGPGRECDKVGEGVRNMKSSLTVLRREGDGAERGRRERSR